jgi:hypothetical protein
VQRTGRWSFECKVSQAKIYKPRLSVAYVAAQYSEWDECDVYCGSLRALPRTLLGMMKNSKDPTTNRITTD